jgi:DNA-binding NarL/FixJ family response regulator
MKSSGKSLLIVEESTEVTSIIINSIAGQKNLGVILTAANYTDAVMLLAQKIADIVLLNMDMKDKKSEQLLKLINTGYKELIVIALSNNGTSSKTFIDAGADFFIDKQKELSSIPLLISSFG